MKFVGINVVEGNFDPGYTAKQRREFEAFLDGFTDLSSLNPLLHPAYERTSLWTDGAVIGLPGQFGPGDDMPANPRVYGRYLQAEGHPHFRRFREETVGGVSQPRPDEPIRIAYVPVRAFLDLPGLPQNVRDIDADTVVAAASFPYEQTADLPDLPEHLLGRSSFGVVEYQPGTTWDINVVFAVHSVGGLAVGRTGLVHDGLDLPGVLHDQVHAVRTGQPPLEFLPPEVVAQYLVDGPQQT